VANFFIRGTQGNQQAGLMKNRICAIIYYIFGYRAGLEKWIN
jgi:hypothetical protein